MEKVRVGLLGVYNPKFPEIHTDTYACAAQKVKILAKEMDFIFCGVIPSIATLAEAMQAARRVEEEGMDFLLVRHVTFPGGEVLRPLASGAARLGLWATAEPNCSGGIRANSLCGVNMMAADLGGSGLQIPHKWFYGPVDSELFRKRLETTIRALAALKGLQKASIVVVGGVVPGFHDLNSDYQLLEKIYGVRIEAGPEISQVIARARCVPASAAAETAREMVSAAKQCLVPEEELERAARVLVVLRQIQMEAQCQALAVRCWPEFIEDFGTLPCAALAHLNQDGTVAACEGDAPGALSMMLLRCLSGRPSTLLDLVDIREEDEAVLFWHCGPSAPELAEEGHCLVQLPVDGIGTALDMRFAPGAATLLRILDSGRRAFLLQGELGPGPAPGFTGCRGWLTNLELQDGAVTTRDLLNTILVNGVPHHYALTPGFHREALLEALAWLNVGLVNRVPYQPYLQVGW